MKSWIYAVLQCTWGFPQTLLGLFVLLTTKGCRRYWYHGVLVTEWRKGSSLSLGLFVFLAKHPPRDKHHPELRSYQPTLVHEYGHTVQSLLLGPLYLIVIGLPSLLWCSLPSCERCRREQAVSYFSFYTERWANAWGEWTTGEKSPGQAWI